MKALIDTCIIIDILQQRDPFCHAANDILHAVSDNKLTGVLTAKSPTDIHYIIRRSIHNETTVRKHLSTLFSLFAVADTRAADCERALVSKMSDYEDAIMVETAKRIAADCIVTRNLKDYAQADIPVLSPEDCLAKLAK